MFTLVNMISEHRMSIVQTSTLFYPHIAATLRAERVKKSPPEHTILEDDVPSHHHEEEHLDLTGEQPTDRATVHFEMVKIHLTMPNWLGGLSIKLESLVRSGSPLQLALAGILIMSVAYGIGVPTMIALITALCAPALYYFLARLLPGRQTE